MCPLFIVMILCLFHCAIGVCMIGDSFVWIYVLCTVIHCDLVLKLVIHCVFIVMELILKLQQGRIQLLVSMSISFCWTQNVLMALLRNYYWSDSTNVSLTSDNLLTIIRGQIDESDCRSVIWNYVYEKNKFAITKTGLQKRLICGEGYALSVMKNSN